MIYVNKNILSEVDLLNPSQLIYTKLYRGNIKINKVEVGSILIQTQLAR